MKIKLLFTVLALLVACNTAYAKDVYRTGFEAPKFTANSPLHGSDNWGSPAPTPTPPFLNLEAATITNLAAKSGRQSVEVLASSLQSTPQVSPSYDAVGSYRRFVGPLVNGVQAGYIVKDANPVVKLEADIKIETNQPTTANDFFCATITPRIAGDNSGSNPSGTTLGETGLCSNGNATGAEFGVQPANEPADFNRPGNGLNKWHHLTEYVDFKNKIISYTVDDTFIAATPIPSDVTSRTILRTAMVVYVRPSGGDKNSYIARFDNFRISAHDEVDD